MVNTFVLQVYNHYFRESCSFTVLTIKTPNTKSSEILLTFVSWFVSQHREGCIYLHGRWTIYHQRLWVHMFHQVSEQRNMAVCSPATPCSIWWLFRSQVSSHATRTTGSGPSSAKNRQEHRSSNEKFSMSSSLPLDQNKCNLLTHSIESKVGLRQRFTLELQVKKGLWKIFSVKCVYVLGIMYLRK